MPDPVQPPLPASHKPHSNFNNWISSIGAVIAAGGLFSFAFLVWMDFTQGDKNPYLGIFTYIVAPGFLIGGLVIAFVGAWMQRRWSIKYAATVPDRWRLDFSNPRQRRSLILLGSGAVGFLVLSAFGSYETYNYSESTQFCGQVCHQAMNPEFVAYQRGAHARVSCVECHVGSGTKWFIKAKINGTHQLIAYTFDSYKRPIATPIKNLRPAQDTCEKCHWPAKFHGNIDVINDHFLSDKKNTAFSVRLLMHVNTGQPGNPVGGIHWHVNVNERVEYYADDEKRQDIPWIRVTNLKDGTSKIFRTEAFKGEPPADQVRVMDCMDCHNRPAHVFPTANDVVERAMAAGALGTKLPNIKRVAVQAMTQKEIATDAGAPQQIADYLRRKYPDAPGAARRHGRGAGALCHDDFPRAQGRLAHLSKQHRPQGLARLLPLPRRQAQDLPRPARALERLHFVPHDHRARPGHRTRITHREGAHVQAPRRRTRSRSHLLRLPQWRHPKINFSPC